MGLGAIGKTLIRVLIVEDHEVTRVGLSYSLAREADIEILSCCSDSDSGLELCAKLRPDIVLLDLHLPGSMGPRSTVEAFCRLGLAKIVVFSSEKRQAFIDTVMQLGAAAYVLKSESTSTIVSTIREIAANQASLLPAKNMPVRSGPIDVLSRPTVKLTEAEQHLLTLFAKGLKYQEIADLRHTSQSTVRKQCELLLEKLALSTREELISWAAHNGYGSLDE